ncbi:MAG: hypothetical protein FWG65_04390 [Turicibacter sp.]|nr:hypothetical protein [Turicibacter sp.]
MEQNGQKQIMVRTSIPSLQNKVKMKIKGPVDAIYWYIKFNYALDESTVSGQTMNVTDTDGYIMRTVISYRPKHNTISVSPLDTYEEDRYYLLNISRRVRSAKGKNLRSTIHILFKLFDNQVSDFKVLEKGAKVPIPRARPADYDSMPPKTSPNYFERKYIDSTPPGKMSPVSYFVNPAVVVIGALVAAAGVFMWDVIIIMGGLVVCLLGLLHIAVQLQNAELRSKMSFNKGVKAFNREQYLMAERMFRKAINIDPENELAKYGVRKAEIYKSGGLQKNGINATGGGDV